MAKPRGGGSCELTERPRGLADAGRSRAEVRLDEERLTREPGGCAAPDHLANREHVAALHDRECLPRVLLDEQDRRALLVEPLDHPHDLFDDEGRQPPGRLVEHEEPRTRHERACDAEHLLLAARERARALRLSLTEDGEDLA